ncbi:MAG: DUF1214 domain-containing protein [Bacteroidota bacterium]
MKKMLFGLVGAYRKIRLTWLKINGKTEQDVHEQRIISGKAWDEFCDSLKTAGAALVYGNAPTDPFSQAEGYRYLARLLRTGLDAFVEHNDPQFPTLKRMVHETAKIGADNPDNYYQNAQISGDYEYRITGKRNSIYYLSFHVMNGNYGSAEGIETCSEIETHDLTMNEDGTFEIILSPKKKGQNWLKVEPETTLLMVRQTFMDRDNETPAELKLECLTGTDYPAPLTAEQIDNYLSRVSLFVTGTPIWFSRWANDFSKHPNQLPLLPHNKQKGAGADKNLVYYHSYYQLAEDECLVIETPIPECDYWNFQVNNYWMESLDYRYFKIHINKHTAKYNSDGSVTVVVAKHPVNHPNYLTTAGHDKGTMLWRWYKPNKQLTPNCSVMKIESFSSSLSE